MANKPKLQRYGHVDLIEIPADLLQQIRAENSSRAEADPLLPRFSPEMEYVFASKTHLVLAQKLAMAGSRSLFNMGRSGHSLAAQRC